MSDTDIDAFLRWFQSNGGYLDTNAMGITDFLDSGRGGVAMCDIPKGHTLFTLPRAMTLSTRTSPLPALFGLDAWRTRGLNKGWVGLILCMMWEDAWAHESDGDVQGDAQAKWGPYIRTLPTTFDTPMFWSPEELEELRGTALIDKIGRDDAEQAYYEQLVPAIKTFPALFPPSHHGKWYTLDAYHRAGSRILSRSFTVTRWADDSRPDHAKEGDGGQEEGSDLDDAEDFHLNASIDSSTHADDNNSALEDVNEGQESDSDGEEENDPSDVAMVPMADVLNARWGSENAKLFREPLVLRMVTTKDIRQGEQILNTYGDLPNSDLLRRYGHIDLVQLTLFPASDKDGDVEMEVERTDTDVKSILHFGNPSDVVEIRADSILDVIQMKDSKHKGKDVHARIEWWLDEGEDDAFVLGLPESGSDSSALLPPALISLTRLLLLPEHDFNIAHSKGKLPKGNLKKVDVKEVKKVLEILSEVVRLREGMYVGGSVEDEASLLSGLDILSKHRRHAVIVRLGEKRILRNVRQTITKMIAERDMADIPICKKENSDTKNNEKVHQGRGKDVASGRKRVLNRAEEDSGRKRIRK